MTLAVGSLFAGIGGLELGLERAGMAVRWQVEKDEWCRRVLAKHWPDVARYGDIKELDPHELEPVDVICGGFPCQPVSLAGRGRAQADARWLWPEFARIVRGVRPRYVLVENVPGLLVRGFGDVLGDLAELGFDAEWQSIPAAAVGAPHLRWRVFVVAYATGVRSEDQPMGVRRQEESSCSSGSGFRPGFTTVDAGVTDVGRAATRTSALGIESSRDVADADAERCGERAGTLGRGRSKPANGGSVLADAAGEGRPPTLVAEGGLSAEPLGSGEAVSGGRPEPERFAWWATEPDVGRVAHGVPSRVDRLRGLGNAVVPQVAEYAGRRIVEFDAARSAA